MLTVDGNLNFLSKILKEVEEYYGIELENDDINKITARIRNSITAKSSCIPKYFNIKHKGQIVKGRLGNILSSELMNVREQYEQVKFTQEDWENCLLPLSDRLTYCEASSTIYSNVDSEIREWLMKNGHCDLMYKLVCNMKIMPKLKGETAKIYDAFIRKGKNIEIKKDLLTGSIDTDDDLWIIRYLEDLYTDDNILEDFDSNTYKIFKQNASDFGILHEDLRYRLRHGMTLMEAVDIGRQEKEQYGFNYKTKDSSNFINYLKWYIRNEKTQQGE